MKLPYRKFARYLLCDIAERTKNSDNTARFFQGNHISRQLVQPVRGKGETLAEFAIRNMEFKKNLPRGSDDSYRLALAHEAFVRDGQCPTSAAVSVVELLEKIPKLTERLRRRWASHGIAHKEVKHKIGTTRRNFRRKQTAPGFQAICRREESIRCGARRYKSKHKDFGRAFAAEFGYYRAMFCRDDELRSEEEAMYRRLLARCEAELNPWHEVTAMHTVNLARILHEQKEFDEALPLYWLGLARSMAAPLWAGNLDYAKKVVSSILSDIENCQNKRGPTETVDQMMKSGHPRLYSLTMSVPACRVAATA
jgi:hypothetical protein